MVYLGAALVDLLAITTIVMLMALISVVWCGSALQLAGMVGAADDNSSRWTIGAAAGIALWAWLTQQALQIAHVTRGTGQRYAACPPDSATILREHPPRVADEAAVHAEIMGPCGSKLHRAANDAVIEMLRDQIERGRELGAQVFAYHHGR